MLVPRFATRMALALTAVALSIIGLAGCGVSGGASVGTQAQSTPTLPPGWTYYHDTRLGFQVPVPPGWQISDFDAGPADGSCTAYDVALVPPGHIVLHDQGATEKSPEFMTINVKLTCPAWQPSDDRNVTPSPAPVEVAGTKATFYQNATSDEYEHSAVTAFGGHQYIFFLHAPASKPGDASMFLTLLAHFIAPGT